jgi:cell fate (sporulation/competence/biofilm development) regulator YmcA (YheA/YmcA/DUF963 family)
MAKRAREPEEKVIRESFIILIKLMIQGAFSEITYSVDNRATVGDVRKMLNDLHNPAKSSLLTLIQSSISPNTKLTAGYDKTLLKSLSGFSLYGPPNLQIHAIFKERSFKQSLVPIVEGGNSENVSDVHKYLRVIQILNRNAKTCALNAQQNKSPLNRERFNAPEEPISKRPKVEDFAKCTMDISDTLYELSQSMKNLSNKLFEASDQTEMDTTTSCLLENNMDTCRYLAPLLHSLSTINVPIGKSGAESELGLNNVSQAISGQNRMMTRNAI